MKPKIVLKPIFHHNEWRYAIIFAIENRLTLIVKSINGIKWSQTNKCWHAPLNEKALKEVLTSFREIADIDISLISSGTDKLVSGGRVIPSVDKIKIQDQTTGKGTKTGNEASADFDLPDNFENLNVPEPENNNSSAIIKVAVNKGYKSGYGPVQFAINEDDGRLVIKFLGRYDQEWVKEILTYGKPVYDKARKEWLLRWSQLTVDSLSDYFSSQGVKVKVLKSVVSEELKEVRADIGSEVRERDLLPSSMGGIELVREYLEEKRYSKRTVDSYLAHLEFFFKYFHKSDPFDLKDEEISKFINDFIIRLGYSSSYQNIIISAIKIYYSISSTRDVNLGSLGRPRRSRALPKVFSKDEVQQIFNVTRNIKHKVILWIIYSCGLRRSEVVNIKLTDLDKERGVLHIRQGKGNVDRMVPIPQKVWEKIAVYMKGYSPEMYLFEGRPGCRYSVESVYSVFKQSLRRAGIKKDVGVHCLRHSYATHLHESGLDIRYIQELLGHKSTRTTEIYTHVSRRNLFAIRSPIEDIDIE